MSDTRDEIRRYIIERFLHGESLENLTDETALVTTGILDSLATMMLVSFLEERYEITLAAHEASVDNLNTVADIGNLVERKRAT